MEGKATSTRKRVQREMSDTERGTEQRLVAVEVEGSRWAANREGGREREVERGRGVRAGAAVICRSAGLSSMVPLGLARRHPRLRDCECETVRTVVSWSQLVLN